MITDFGDGYVNNNTQYDKSCNEKRKKNPHETRQGGGKGKSSAEFAVDFSVTLLSRNMFLRDSFMVHRE